VLNIEYATQIARDWNVKHADSDFCGFVTKFEVKEPYVLKFPIQVVGASSHQELWVPAAELSEFNSHIAGKITVEESFYGLEFKGEIDPKTNLPKSIPQ
jgi:hypothetical protein